MVPIGLVLLDDFTYIILRSAVKYTFLETALKNDENNQKEGDNSL